ncbi:MAG: hypothetical protein IPM29_22345 [Planctomycetes bacterium]|nr:hypothetical protein [Planctomycetota bacterium]
MTIGFDDLARALLRTRSTERAAAVLAARAPTLHAQLAALRDQPATLAAWGLSRNRDENVGAAIVEPRLLAAIGRVAGVELPGDVCHAGLLHTYGYLLSRLPTPYGLKRERWTEPRIERGLALRRPVLRPEPHAGTLLTNATWLLGHIAWVRRSSALRALRALRDTVAPELAGYAFDRLRVARIRETVRLAGTATVHLHTDLVALDARRDVVRPRYALLVHWIDDSRAGRPLLQTAFPVTRRVADALLDGSRAGRDPALRTRYNTYVVGFDAPRPGRRRIEPYTNCSMSR